MKKKPNNVIPFETVKAVYYNYKVPVFGDTAGVFDAPVGTADYGISLYLRWIDAINGG